VVCNAIIVREERGREPRRIRGGGGGVGGPGKERERVGSSKGAEFTQKHL